ncbi:uncharacterized protein LOC108038690 [Drosophila rhopaloa]|uniref:Uncharacterized protein LOC108038690 n=1 Tax=Drosophila rhopaloa TaxID=1041015 RepID=A0A6P4DZL9_DRORH|nr:uncharacterized protein LOC108038690 [Drosophila rhopaloa]
MSKSQSQIFGPSPKGCRQKVRLAKTPADGESGAQAVDLSLCGKPSFLVCSGKKSPNLTEVDSSTDLRQAHSLAIQQNALKVQGIMNHQQHIIEIVDSVNESIAGRKDLRRGDEYGS